jgi:hypothetical protein
MHTSAHFVESGPPIASPAELFSYRKILRLALAIVNPLGGYKSPEFIKSVFPFIFEINTKPRCNCHISSASGLKKNGLPH